MPLSNLPPGVTDHMIEEAAGAFDEDEPAPERGRWWGSQFCPHPGQPCIDGCHFCGRDVGSITGDHDHTQVKVGGEIEYSCVCPSC